MTGLPQPMMIVAAAPYLVLAAVGFTMWRDVRVRPHWEWLWAFGGLFGLHLWVSLLAVVPGFTSLRWLAGLLAGMAYLSLLEFARCGVPGHARFSRWVIWAGCAGLAALVLAGYGERHGLVSLLLGVPAGILAMQTLCDRQHGWSVWGRRWGVSLGVALLLIPAVSSAEEMLPPGLEGQGIAVLAAGVVAALSAVLLDAWHIHHRADAGRDSAAGDVEVALNHLINAAIAGFVLVVVLVAGITIARLLAETERQELRSAARQQDDRIGMMIAQAHDMGEHMADSMSGSPLVVRRFAEDGPDAVANANNILDRYVRSFRCDVAYLLDTRGVVLASSNRGRPDSLLGANLGDRKYFLRAVAGETCAEMRLGGITGTRGIYAAAPVRDAEGRIIGVATVKNELESLERQLGTGGYIDLVDSEGMIWLATRPDWRYQRMWNRQTPATRPASAQAGRPPADLLQLPDRPPQTGELLMLGGGPCEVNRTQAGAEGWSLISFTPIRPALRTWAVALLVTGCGMLVTLGVASSIRLRAQHAIVHQQKQALSTSLQEMERLMSVLSHDLRSPLAAAHSAAEYLLECPEFRGETRQTLELIAEQQLGMAEMVSRLLDAIRIRNGVMEWAWESVSVREVLESAHRTVASLPVRAPEVCVDLDGRAAPDTIHGDAQAIIRLVTNLGTNAVRHTKQGSVQISARPEQCDGMHYLVIEVTDTGGGIAPEALPLLGRPFVLGARQGGSGGSGLGLAIAAGICAAHGGRLTVRSQLGRGTTFTAWLRADLAGPVREGGEPTIQVETDAP